MRSVGAALLVLALSACQTSRLPPHGWWQSISVAGHDSCVGAAISVEWVVTVRHCVQRLGDRQPMPPGDLTLTDQAGSKRQVLRVVVPPGAFNHLGDITGRDVALLHVERPMPIVAHLGSWADQDEQRLLLSRGHRLNAIRLELRPFNSQSVFSPGVTCIGDSGSPLIDTNGRMLALASWRSEPGCDRGISVFTRLDVHREWIEANL